ncbi:hypothetical protein Tco_0829155 [Tanacetum coccineum]
MSIILVSSVPFSKTPLALRLHPKYLKHIDWGQVKFTKDIMEGYVMPKYGKTNWMEDDSWTDIILDDVYNKFYRDEEEETEVAKESEDIALSVMKEKFLSMVEFEKATVKDYKKLVVTDGMVDYVLEKYRNNWKCGDEIVDVILEDLWLKYGKGDKGKGKVHDIQNRLEKLEVDLARAIKAKQAEHDKGKGKQLDDDDLDAHDDDLDALDLENRIKKLEEDFGRLLKKKKANEAKEAKNAKLAKETKKAKKAKEAMLAEVVQVSSNEDDSSDEGLFRDEDVVLFNDVKYLLTDAEISMLNERPTTFRAPTASTSIRSITPTASTSNAQAASTLAPRGYRKIVATGCVLGLRAPNDPNAPPPSATRKRKSKK